MPPAETKARARPIGATDFRKQLARLLRDTAARVGDPLIVAWVGKLTREDLPDDERPQGRKRKPSAKR